MAVFERICSRAELPREGKAREFTLANGRPLCVAMLNGQLSVLDNECPHNGGPLAEGLVQGGRILCPWHAWAFDLQTGEAEHDPRAKVAVFETKIEGEDVLVSSAPVG